MAFHLDQPVGIDPCVDVVFLELFGAHVSLLGRPTTIHEYETHELAALQAFLDPQRASLLALEYSDVHILRRALEKAYAFLPTRSILVDDDDSFRWLSDYLNSAPAG